MLQRDQDDWADNVSSKDLFSIHADYHGTNIRVKMAHTTANFFSGVTLILQLSYMFFCILPHSRLGGWEDLLDELAPTLLQLTAGSLLFILIGGCDQARCALIGNISCSEVRRQLPPLPLWWLRPCNVTALSNDASKGEERSRFV